MISPSSAFVSCCYFLLLLVYHVAAQAPTCANGQQPKLDSNLNPIQCLPGTSQRQICGPNHNCYFTGLNYMCCPSNEPYLDNQPSCPYPKLTVLDPHGFPLKCSPISRTCPGDDMHCADVGLGYICCETPSFQKYREHKTSTTTVAASKYRFKTTTPPPEEELECPENSLGMLNNDGTRLICNSRSPCPGDDSFCFGEYKRSICCQKYLFASDILDSSSKEVVPKKGGPLKSINVSMRKPLPGKVHEGQYIKPTTTSTTTTTTTSTTTTSPPHIIDNEFPQVAINSIGVRRRGAVTSTGMVQKLSEVGRNAEITRTWIPKSAFNFPTPPTTTTTAPTTSETPTTTSTKSSISMKPVRRNRVHGIQTFATGNANNDFKPASIDLERNNQHSPDRHVIAQKLLSYQIRNGWPYDERFYRPDIEVYTDEQKSEIARMRFLPQS